LFGHQGSGHAVEDLLEQYAYTPGGFQMEVDREAVQVLTAEAAHWAGAAAKVAKGAKEVPGLEHAVGSTVDEAVHGFVGGKVEPAAEKPAEKVRGPEAGPLAAQAAGAAAGLAVGKLAGKVAGELAGKLAQRLGVTHVLAGLVGDDKGMSRFSEKMG